MIKIYDNANNLVRSKRMGNVPAGPNSWVWNGKDSGGVMVAPGKYKAKITATSYAGERAKASKRPGQVLSYGKYCLVAI